MGEGQELSHCILNQVLELRNCVTLCRIPKVYSNEYAYDDYLYLSLNSKKSSTQTSTEDKGVYYGTNKRVNYEPSPLIHLCTKMFDDFF